MEYKCSSKRWLVPKAYFLIFVHVLYNDTMHLASGCISTEWMHFSKVVIACVCPFEHSFHLLNDDIRKGAKPGVKEATQRLVQEKIRTFSPGIQEKWLLWMITDTTLLYFSFFSWKLHQAFTYPMSSYPQQGYPPPQQGYYAPPQQQGGYYPPPQQGGGYYQPA